MCVLFLVKCLQKSIHGLKTFPLDHLSSADTELHEVVSLVLEGSAGGGTDIVFHLKGLICCIYL